MKKVKCKKDDYYETPPELLAELKEEFDFDLDAAATDDNTVADSWFTERVNALTMDWTAHGDTIFCNPPYSKEGQKDEFIRKASEAAKRGSTVVMVIPAKVNTHAFHEYIWNKEKHCPRDGVQIRFLEGRPVFYRKGKRAKGSGRNEIMIVVFKPTARRR